MITNKDKVKAQILSYISAHDGCKGDEVQESLQLKLYIKNNYLAELRRENLICYNTNFQYSVTGLYKAIKL